MFEPAAPKFKINDMVVNTSRDPMRPNILGEVGRVRQVLRNIDQPEGNPFFYVVEFKTNVNGHDGHGMGRWGYFWALGEDYLTLQNSGQKAKKGGNMNALSTLAKRTFDEDTKALIKIGVLDNSLEVADPNLVVELLVSLFGKELAGEAKKRLEEQKADEKSE